MRCAARSQSTLIKALPESSPKQMGAACFSDLLEEPSLLVLLLLLLIFHYCLFPSLPFPSSPCVLQCEGATLPLSRLCCHDDCACIVQGANMTSVSHDVLNDNLSVISHFSPQLLLLMKHDAFLLLPLMEA